MVIWPELIAGAFNARQRSGAGGAGRTVSLRTVGKYPVATFALYEPQRYWRLIFSTSSSSGLLFLENLSMASTPGGDTLLGSGTATGANTYYGTPVGALPGGGGWGANGYPTYWQYDFGASPVVVREVIFAVLGPVFGPPAVQFTYSDDGATFGPPVSFTPSLPWGYNVTQTFDT